MACSSWCSLQIVQLPRSHLTFRPHWTRVNLRVIEIRLSCISSGHDSIISLQSSQASHRFGNIIAQNFVPEAFIFPGPSKPSIPAGLPRPPLPGLAPRGTRGSCMSSDAHGQAAAGLQEEVPGRHVAPPPDAVEPLLPAGLQLRTLEADDYEKGYLDLLAQLTVVGTVSREAFRERVAEIQSRAPDYHVAVIEDLPAGRVVATATLLIERKILRQCGLVGHIEDVAVDSTQRGRRLGQRLIEELTRTAKKAGCYKIILDCSEGNIGFYETCGFKRKELQMAMYL